jgi:hypothetical protein
VTPARRATSDEDGAVLALPAADAADVVIGREAEDEAARAKRADVDEFTGGALRVQGGKVPHVFARGFRLEGYAWKGRLGRGGEDAVDVDGRDVVELDAAVGDEAPILEPIEPLMLRVATEHEEDAERMPWCLIASHRL